MELENCTEICLVAKKILSQYDGKIIESDKEISIISNNLLGEKKVECKVTVGLLNCKELPFTVDAYEKTYSIIGGCGCPCRDKKEVEERLVSTLLRYKFKQKEQMSIFDFDFGGETNG